MTRSFRGGTIEPFDPARHDRSAFSCGAEQADNFFMKTAEKLVKADSLRVFVMVDAKDRLIGFYAISAHAIDHGELPPQFARDRPAHGSISAVHISMIGVDVRFAGQGFDGDLLADCLARIAGIADNLGIVVVMLDVPDCGDPARVEMRRRLYAGYGFTPLPSNEMRLFLPIATVQQLTGV